MGKKGIVIGLAIAGAVALGCIGVSMWAKHKAKQVIEAQFEGMGAEVEVGRVKVKLLARGVELEDVRVRVQRKDAGVRDTASGLAYLSVDVKRAEARGVKLKGPEAKEVEVEVRSAAMATAKGDKHAVVEVFGMRVRVEGMEAGVLGADSVRLGFGVGESDQNDIVVRGLECEGVDVGRLLAEKVLAVERVAVGGAKMKSYKNRKIYEAPRKKPLLWESLQGVPIAYEVGRVEFEEADIEYAELGAEADRPGVVTLTGMEGEGKNLTNIAEGHERFFEVDLTTKLMGAGRLEAVWRMPVAAEDDYWELEGRLGRTDLRSFNGALEPLMNVRVDSCNLHSLDFRIEGDHEKSSVALVMLYDGLSVEMLKKHERKRMWLPTIILDDIILKNANPAREGAEVRQGSGEHVHDRGKSTFNFVWKSLVPGITQTVM